MRRAMVLYFDNNASTPLSPRAAEAMQPILDKGYGNPSSAHLLGREARKAISEAREKAARALGVSPEEIVFTSSGTEANNLALLGAFLAAQRAYFQRTRPATMTDLVAAIQIFEHLVKVEDDEVSAIRPLEEIRRRFWAGPTPWRNHIVTCGTEHPSVLGAARFLEQLGADVTSLVVSARGEIDQPTYESSFLPHTLLVSLMLANNETGTIHPIRDLARLAHERGALFHTDAVQALGKIPVRPADLGVDLLSLSAHKFHGPRGVGILWVRSGLPLLPVLHGGNQEAGLRPGTENTAAIVGAATALDEAVTLQSEAAPKMRELRDLFEARLREKIPGVKFNGALENRLPNTSSVSFPALSAEQWIMALDLEGVAVSAGAACHSGAVEPSHVLRAIGTTPDEAERTVRFSFSRLIRVSDIEAAAEIVTRIFQRGQARRPA